MNSRTSRRLPYFRALLCGAACASLALSCASDEKVLVGDPPDTRVGSDGGVTTIGSMDAGIELGDGLDAMAAQHSDAAWPGDGAVAMPEVCDGLDNDLDGIVDDLDVAHDGICDCLRIATLGSPGGSGKGNVFADWLNSRSDTPAVDLGGMVLTPQLLAPFEVIVAEDLHAMKRAYSSTEIDALEAWVRAGGGLMTLIGYASPDELSNANAILARFGTSYGSTQILPRTSSSTVPITTWLGPHPVVDGVTRIGVDNGYPVQGSGTTLAQGGGYDLLKVQELDQGHLIVWADEWITYDTEWSDHPDYQVARFWVNSIKWLTAERICQVPVVPL